jgi:phosphotransferase system  glucose/maltose/N-acetylglucosamine-specific IIC component
MTLTPFIFTFIFLTPFIFFGASVGDVITSMIATAAEARINVFEYFTALQQKKAQVKASLENYLPWNYLDNIG